MVPGAAEGAVDQTLSGAAPLNLSFHHGGRRSVALVQAEHQKATVRGRGAATALPRFVDEIAREAGAVTLGVPLQRDLQGTDGRCVAGEASTGQQQPITRRQRHGQRGRRPAGVALQRRRAGQRQMLLPPIRPPEQQRCHVAEGSQLQLAAGEVEPPHHHRGAEAAVVVLLERLLCALQDLWGRDARAQRRRQHAGKTAHRDHCRGAGGEHAGVVEVADARRRSEEPVGVAADGLTGLQHPHEFGLQARAEKHPVLRQQGALQLDGQVELGELAGLHRVDRLQSRLFALLAPTRRLQRSRQGTQQATVTRHRDGAGQLASGEPLAGLGQRLQRPLQALTEASERLATGELAGPVAVAGDGGLLRPLAAALEAARRRQQSEQARLQAIDAVQSSQLAQLDLAVQLQRALLPQDRVFFGPRLQAELVGVLQPGQPVGGDAYGFLAPAPGICHFHYASVLATGTAAVVAMSRLAGMLAAALRAGVTPPQILQRAQEALKQDDDGSLRAAVVVGRLDLASGELQLAALGDVAPLLLRRADGGQQHLALAGTAPLQRDTSGAPATLSVALAAGDRLLLPGAGLASDAAAIGSLQIALERHAERHGARLARDLIDEARQGGGSAAAADRGLLVLSLHERD